MRCPSMKINPKRMLPSRAVPEIPSVTNQPRQSDSRYSQARDQSSGLPRLPRTRVQNQAVPIARTAARTRLAICCRRVTSG